MLFLEAQNLRLQNQPQLSQRQKFIGKNLTIKYGGYGGVYYTDVLKKPELSLEASDENKLFAGTIVCNSKDLIFKNTAESKKSF